MDFYNENQESVKNEDEIKNANKLKKRNLVTPLIATGLSVLTAVGITAAAFSMNQSNAISSSNDDVKSSDKNTNPSNNTKGNMIYDSSTNSIIINSDGSVNNINNSTDSNVKSNSTTSSKVNGTSNTTSSKSTSSTTTTSSKPSGSSSTISTSSTIDNTKKIFSNNYLDKSFNSVNPTHIVDRTNQFKPDSLTLKSRDIYITTYGDWHYIHDGMGGISKINNKTAERIDDVFDFSGNCYLRIGNYLFISTSDLIKIDLSNDKITKFNFDLAHSMCTNGTDIYYVKIIQGSSTGELRKLSVNAAANTQSTLIATGVASNNVQLNWNNDTKKVEVNNNKVITPYSVN